MGWTDVFSRKKTVKPVTYSAEAMANLRQAMTLLETAFDATADGLLIISQPGKVAGFNRPFARMWKLRKSLVKSHDRQKILQYLVSQIHVAAPLTQLIQARSPSVRPKELKLRDGRVFECFSIPRRRKGKIVGRVLNFRDVTSIKKAEEKLQHLAYHDSLTGLPNRTLLADRFEIALAQARRSDEIVALFLMDLDRFKEVNDTHGHQAGDQVLSEVSKRLRASLRAGDTVARLGGDEFLILLPRIKEESHLEIIARRLFDSIRPKVRTEAGPLEVNTSMGIAVYPRDGQDTDTLMKKVDAALYQAKQQGRNIYRFYQVLPEDVSL